MSSEPTSTPRYLLKPPELEPASDVEAAADLLGGDATVLSPADVPGSLPSGGGWLIVPPGISDADVGRILLELSRLGDPWCLLVLRRDEEGVRVLPLSPGPIDAPSSAADRLGEAGLACGYLGHRWLLRELSRVRHDVNNALTSALAETQFMRMDAEEGSETASGLAIVEDQLQRIRDLMHELATLRLPRP